jgi:hypothetical protein
VTGGPALKRAELVEDCGGCVWLSGADEEPLGAIVADGKFCSFVISFERKDHEVVPFFI